MQMRKAEGVARGEQGEDGEKGRGRSCRGDPADPEKGRGQILGLRQACRGLLPQYSVPLTKYSLSSFTTNHKATKRLGATIF